MGGRGGGGVFAGHYSTHTKHEISLAVNCVTCVYSLSVMQLLAWLVAILLPVFQKSVGMCRCLVTQVNVNRLSIDLGRILNVKWAVWDILCLPTPTFPTTTLPTLSQKYMFCLLLLNINRYTLQQ